MGFYNRWILPQLLEVAMRQKNFVPFRERTAGAARGRVLEIGIGSGLNLSSFRPNIESVCGVDPSAELLAKAGERVANVGFPVRLLEASSEKLPLEDKSFDTVVMTFTMCSIPDVGAALLEIRRVLKPEGALLFAEHGRAPDPDVMRWQDRITRCGNESAVAAISTERLMSLFKPLDFGSSVLAPDTRSLLRGRSLSFTKAARAWFESAAPS